MIILTGGAGMIGSIIAWHLNTILNEDQFVIVDDLINPNQEKNISKRKFSEFIHKNDLNKYLIKKNKISAVIHMGAISTTTENNFNRLLNSNIRYSQMLWCWCAKNNIPFIYASSAATYGLGEHGYNDSEKEINNLAPLNAYGYSKHFFDQWVLQQSQVQSEIPPQWCGLKFFNVYGPNEYHKGRMASVVYHAFKQYQKEQEIRLFKSEHSDYDDGMQLRDFIYVKDAVECVVYLLKNRNISGLFNVGTGKAKPFKAIGESVANNLGGNNSAIKYIDLPNDLKEKYQYFTEANINKIREVGFKSKFKTLSEGISDYVQNYLVSNDPYA
ncbi:MAG: ADP-glyceromanno-heptose 6-epimerase [Methylophilaceae bacterium]|nr:ADP-glyceromanno-heptose 6-epimerase [Methylophilaceae bacterium]